MFFKQEGAISSSGEPIKLVDQQFIYLANNILSTESDVKICTKLQLKGCRSYGILSFWEHKTGFLPSRGRVCITV